MFVEPELNSFQIYQHVYQIYPDIPQYSEDHPTIEKYQTINKRFAHIYAKQPKYFVKCPGSITILGNSADYSQLPYLESCTPNDIVIALSPNNQKLIRVNHFEKSRYPEQTISLLEAELKDNSDFRNNIILALKINKALKVNIQQGVDVLIYSNLLNKSDLSKNTALVYCFILGIAAVNGSVPNIRKQKLIEELNKFTEAFPNFHTRQAPIYAQNNTLVDCSTKRCFNFVEGYTFVLAHSCTPNSAKQIQIKEGKKLNLGRCEVRIGIQIVKVEIGIEKEIRSLKQLQQALGYSIAELLQSIEQYVPNKPLSAEDIETITETSLIQILKQIPFSNNVIENYKTYHPYNSIVYLLKQQLMLQNLEKLLSSNVQNTLKAQKIEQMLDQNRTLQKEHFEQQSQHVSRLIEVAGQVPEGKHFKVVGDTTKGNILFFTEKQRAKSLIQHLSKQYYESKDMKMVLSDSVDQYVYEIIPSMGAAILDPQYEIWL